MPARPLPFALLALLAAAPASAVPPGIAGTWRVTGDIAGHPFALDCRFSGDGAKFGGTCTDVTSGGDNPVKAGKVYTLHAGAVNGNSVSWSYSTRVMLMAIDLDYAGTLAADRIAGTVTTIGGRKGPFLALRKG